MDPERICLVRNDLGAREPVDPDRPRRRQTDFYLAPFAAKVSFAFGDTKNLMKSSATLRCEALVISAAV